MLGYGLSFFFVRSYVFILFALVFAIFTIVIFKGITQWNRNNHSPRLNVEAIVVSKREDVTFHTNDGMTYHDTNYFVTFEVVSGDRMEFLVSGRTYGLLVEGDHGELEFQGTRYLGFERY